MNWYLRKKLIYPVHPEELNKLHGAIVAPHNATNWYQKIILAYGGINAEIEPDGAFAISGNTFMIKDQLKAMGFRGSMIQDPQTGKNLYIWRIHSDAIKSNPTMIQELASLGVPTGALETTGPTTQVPPAQQTAPLPTQQGKTWFLSKNLSISQIPPGDPIVVSKEPSGEWTAMTRDGQTGIIDGTTIKSKVEIIPTPDGKSYTAPDPSSLFTIFDQLQADTTDITETPKIKSGERPKPEDVRLPDHFLSPYNKQIREAFLTGTDKEGNPQNIMVNALAGTGKAQPLEALLLSPKGWVKMGDIAVGDKVYGSDGLPHKVTGVFPQGEKEVFNVEFTDGSNVECCGDHIWLTETKSNRDLCRYHGQPLFARAATITTREITDNLLYKGYPKHYIPLVKPIIFATQKTKIDPYVMGILLGDGSFADGRVTYSTADKETVQMVDDLLPDTLFSRYKGGYDYRVVGDGSARNAAVAEIKDLHLSKKLSFQKHIPNKYKLNDIPTRIAIFQGLMDADGYVDKRGYALELSTASSQLADDIQFIVESLGGTTKITIREPSYTYKGQKKRGRIAYRLHIKLPNHILPFRLRRKLKNYKPSKKYHVRRAIKDITSIGQKECQCISIDSPDNLYVTEHCILTHNTTELKDLASFIQPGERWLYLVFNKKNQLEASSEFPEGVDVATTHSYLGNVIKNAGPEAGGSTQLPPMHSKGEKITRTLDQLIPRDTGRGRSRRFNTVYQQFRWQAVSRIRKIASLAKSFAIDPNKPDALQRLAEVVQKYQIDMDLSSEREGQDRDYTAEILEHARELLAYSLPNNLPQEFDRQDAQIRDQDDTLWYAAIHADQIPWNTNPHYDVVLMDEVQDFNQCQLVVAQKLKEAGARVVGVGDPNQAIYGWRGADSEAFGKLQGVLTEGEAPAMNLPINFRSLPAIIDFVNQNSHVNNLEAAPPEFWQAKQIDPNSGSVETSIPTDMFMSQLYREYQENNHHMKQETAFISRTNAPLVEHALWMLKNDIDFQILGRDLAKELTDHIKKVTYFKPMMKSLPELSRDLSNHLSNLQDQWHGRVSKQDELKEIEGTTEALQAVLEHVSDPTFQRSQSSIQMRTAQDFLQYIEMKLGGQDPDNAKDYAAIKAKKEQDPTATVTLTTAHKSKGMEYERLFVLEPGAFNPAGDKIKTEEEAQQERNLWYVALTRARSSLIIGQDEKKPS